MPSARNYFFLARSSWVVIFLSFCVFILLTWAVLHNKTNLFDENVFHASQKIVSDANTKWLLNISFLGKHSFLIPANISLLVLFAVQKNKHIFLRLLVLALSSVAVMSLIKRLVQRIRPENGMIEGVTNFSFPSGHAFMSVAFYGFLIWWTISVIKQQQLRIAVILFLVLLIIMIGYSRVYLRMHYATDVLAGFTGGTAWLLGCLYSMQKMEVGFGNKSSH